MHVAYQRHTAESSSILSHLQRLCGSTEIQCNIAWRKSAPIVAVSRAVCLVDPHEFAVNRREAVRAQFTSRRPRRTKRARHWSGLTSLSMQAPHELFALHLREAARTPIYIPAPQEVSAGAGPKQVAEVSLNASCY